MLEQKNLKSIDESSRLSITPQFDNIHAISTSHSKDTPPQPHQVIKSSYKDRKKTTSLLDGLGGLYNNIKGACTSNSNK